MSCFFFNDTATTEIYTLSLHDALPISKSTLRNAINTSRLIVSTGDRRYGWKPRLITGSRLRLTLSERELAEQYPIYTDEVREDRKSTRLNSSHANISYAVFCLKKKNTR